MRRLAGRDRLHSPHFLEPRFDHNRRNATMSQTFEQLPEELQLAASAHVKYIQSLDTRKDEYDYWLTEHLRLNGLYWGLTALHLLGRPDALPRAETIDFVLSCQHDSGGFGAAPGHDAHMLSTVSAVQILAMVDAFDDLETRGKGKARVGECASPSMRLRRSSLGC
jgi:geranylgeranyl transferase type-2 subunit beta